jgi:DNA-binding transcriptional regulator GbsR (MarR family)
MAAGDALEDVLMKLADTVGGLMELWGFKRALGRMWAVLYLSPRPLSAQELGERLSMSTGSVSMTLGELVEWGVVNKTWRPGERRDYYEPETSIWKPISRVLRERELVGIRRAIESFEAALAAVAAAVKTRGPEEKKHLRFVAERIESILGLARVGEMLLGAILDGRKIDPKPIMAFFGGD